MQRLWSRCLANHLFSILSYHLTNLCKKPLLFFFNRSAAVSRKIYCIVSVLLKLVSQRSNNKLGGL